MQYVLAIQSESFGSQGATLAYQFAETLLHAGHQISQVFFFQNGVTHGNRFLSPASDELNLQENWKILAKNHRLSLYLCVSAAQRRGVLEENLAEPFVLAGLGEFSKAVFTADRLLTF